MTAVRGSLLRVLLLLASAHGTLAADAPAQTDREAALEERVDAIRSGLGDVERAIQAGDGEGARALVLRLYLDEYEPIEGWWGPGGALATPELADAVAAGETAFHAALAAGGAELSRSTARIRAALGPIETAAAKTGATRRPSARSGGHPIATASPGGPPPLETQEIRAIASELERARAAYGAGRRSEALSAVEHAYLEGFEPLESRLPSELVGRIERAIHLSLRPDIRAGADVARVDATFGSLYADLARADARLASGASFWFGALNAFAIIFREGLEAVLLIGAMLAYLGRLGSGARPERQVYAGVAAGILASIATWILAVTLIPVSGASRELVEGVTALLAVVVLLYVSHWLFQKTYIHDWKAYLEEHLGRALTRGSALAMAGLAFAAVYREGFETVLFYQALMFDAGTAAVLAGFVPGLVVIVAIGYGIVRLGLRLPLKRVFAVTGTILLYLAFVFLGKGLYNLQEAGVFAPTPIRWIPDHEALRQLLGLYPLAETVIAQAALLAVLAAGAVWYRARARRAASSDESAAHPWPAPATPMSRAASPARNSVPEPAESR